MVRFSPAVRSRIHWNIRVSPMPFVLHCYVPEIIPDIARLCHPSCLGGSIRKIHGSGRGCDLQASMRCNISGSA
jgi:hypothetical protein